MKRGILGNICVSETYVFFPSCCACVCVCAADVENKSTNIQHHFQNVELNTELSIKRKYRNCEKTSLAIRGLQRCD
jgi:hypothetical protein